MPETARLSVVWAGPLQPEDSLLHGSAPQPATMRWQRTYIGGLRKAGVRVHWVGHDPHRLWPWGPARVSLNANEVDEDATGLAYNNLPCIRLRSLCRAYRSQLVDCVTRTGAAAIVTYSADPWTSAAAEAAEATGVPWIVVVLDFSDPRSDHWLSFRSATERAAGVAFVSHWAFTHAPVEKKYLIRPAVVERPRSLPGVRQSNSPMLLYAGARARHAGVDRLLAAMSLLRTDDVELVLTGQGKGYDRDIARATSRAPSTTDLGMVPDEQLAGLAAMANALVNPRPIAEEDSVMNFPSKILDYLSYLRPIVSTRSLGMGPEFDEVLTFAAGDQPSDLARAIDDVLGWSSAEVEGAIARCHRFAERHAPADAAREFATWLRQLC